MNEVADQVLDVDRALRVINKLTTNNATYARRWGDAIRERDEARALARQMYMTFPHSRVLQDQYPWLEEDANDGGDHERA